MMYLGDYLEDSTVYIPFTTNAADGGRESFSASMEEADIVILKDGAAMTLDASTITISLDLGARVGFHVVSVDMSNDADFTTGADYAALLYPSDETIDSQAPVGVLASWSCENRVADVARWNGSDVATPTIAGVPEVDVTHWLGTAAATPTAAGVPEVDVTFAAGIPWTFGAITAASFAAGAINQNTLADDTISGAKIENDAISVGKISPNAIGASELAADAVAEIADAVWDELRAGHVTAGSYGEFTGDAAMRGTDSAYTGTPPTAVAIRTEIDSNSTQLAAIVADTNELQTDWADAGRLDALLDSAQGTVQITESYAANGVAPTRDEAIMAIHQMLQQFAISGTSLTVRKLDNATTAFVVTLDDAATPTSAVRV